MSLPIGYMGNIIPPTTIIGASGGIWQGTSVGKLNSVRSQDEGRSRAKKCMSQGSPFRRPQGRLKPRGGSFPPKRDNMSRAWVKSVEHARNMEPKKGVPKMKLLLKMRRLCFLPLIICGIESNKGLRRSHTQVTSGVKRAWHPMFLSQNESERFNLNFVFSVCLLGGGGGSKRPAHECVLGLPFLGLV